MQPSAIPNLPPQFVKTASIDLSKNLPLLLWLNLIGLILFFMFGWFFLHLAGILRPDSHNLSGSLNIWFVIAILIAAILSFILHELIHGFFFWIFTRSHPKFGFKGAYAFAAAPGWYLRRCPYLIVGLAPLVLISLAGLLMIPIIPSFLIIPLLFLMTVNASGAVGDLAVVIWLLRFPHQILIMDHGDAITVFSSI